ncbi:sonic hedgehog protein A-like [Haliotis rufescens]|uniref:sonic hedgehog protein A-like n=1 Tax=Haliotis rufescens TaxID=6454 RepID=UPI001EB09A35|nr:sonic hedgehog protein A-like [Haliotis rufescens]XP_046328143.1 sonic hedgehog protein A-like [Haliotis rufescens]XP_046328144.1 sonic hedgehog protein A-like [Haliotis rufescens]XP_046328145.1 sonic hedgehog protein A-like [Haliotis rufescens]XP_048238082.1 sonic hedgehog protein A-like [Haliotis rufescens]
MYCSLKLVQAVVIILLLVTPLSLQCGPGRGSGRRRRPRKLTPLVFKQHVPNVSENTIGASGLSDGAITKEDPKFKDLVSNENPNIEFKDEERTGADRMMSERCKEKLNMLAISVMNQWPGVKLRVTEAWDEDGTHSKDSLHYEGRAVDITTSDKDRAKYGMLARLAVESGFDWVYYESRNHIHCSVKSDSSVAIKIGGCFPGYGMVTTQRGTVAMDHLAVGDMVLGVGSGGQLEFSEVITFLDRNIGETALFYTITTEDGRTITLTAKHLIYVTDSNCTGNVFDSSVVVYAETVKPGQFLLYGNHDDNVEYLKASRVTMVTSRTERGVYAPLTHSGTIVVDGVVASCYAVINNANIAHLVFAPIRGLYDLSAHAPWLTQLSDVVNTPDPKGVHRYAKVLYNFASLFLSRSVLYVP